MKKKICFYTGRVCVCALNAYTVFYRKANGKRKQYYIELGKSNIMYEKKKKQQQIYTQLEIYLTPSACGMRSLSQCTCSSQKSTVGSD